MKRVSTPYHLCFDVLGNPLRVSVIQSLRRSPKSVSELAAELCAEQSRLSHSLATLKQCNFVESKRKGKKVIYSLRETFLKNIREKDIFEALEKHYAEHGAKCWRKMK